MNEVICGKNAAVSAADWTHVAGGLNPQPEPPGRARLEVVPELLLLQQLRTVAGGLNPQPLPPLARFRA
jgi:hypothetical protein